MTALGYLVEILSWLFLAFCCFALIWGAREQSRAREADRRKCCADMDVEKEVTR